jgi:hypothetical protein
MPHNRKHRSSEELSKTIEHRVSLYSLAALAAGVSLLAQGQPAEGEIIVTKANISVGAGSPAFVDLNNDGLNDFRFSVALGGFSHTFYATLAVTPLTGGMPVGGARGAQGPYASALANGANIGASAHFSTSVARGQVTLERSNGWVSSISSYKLYGKWGLGTPHYLGVRFLINGATHYGWIRLSLSRPDRLSGTITEYAYETVANKKIGAGATADSTDQSFDSQTQREVSTTGPSLGMLALGADGLALWRP